MRNRYTFFFCAAGVIPTVRVSQAFEWLSAGTNAGGRNIYEMPSGLKVDYYMIEDGFSCN